MSVSDVACTASAHLSHAGGVGVEGGGDRHRQRWWWWWWPSTPMLRAVAVIR